MYIVGHALAGGEKQTPDLIPLPGSWGEGSGRRLARRASDLTKTFVNTWAREVGGVLRAGAARASLRG